MCLFSLFYQAQFVTIIYVWNYTFIHYETILIRIFWYYETFYVFSTTAGSSHNVSGVWMLHIVTRSRPAHSCLLIQPLCDPNPYSDLYQTSIEKYQCYKLSPGLQMTLVLTILILLYAFTILMSFFLCPIFVKRIIDI